MKNIERFQTDEPAPKTKVQVLLIEDNLADAHLFRACLFENPTLNYNLVHVETMLETLDAVRVEEPDVIILDLSLPDADGLQGLDWINEAIPSVPIIVHSGHDNRHLIEEAFKQGAQDYLVKGTYDAELLNRVIRYAIERQQTLRELKLNEKRLRSIIQQTSDGVVIVSAEETVLFANPAAEALLGSSTQDMLGKAFPYPLTIDKTTELEIGPDEDNHITVEMSAAPILWEDQLAFLASLRDITAHKLLQEQLTDAKEKAEELARLKASFLASMSHELRTPLTGIIGFADTLINEITFEQHRDFAQIIKQAGERLLVMINSVLDLSQLEAGTFVVKKEPIRVMAVAQEVLALLQPIAKEKGLSLGLTTFAPDALVPGDKILLQRILDNLVGNALKFTDTGSVIVEIDTTDTQVTLRVKDTGIGITEAFIPHLFDQFRQESDGLQRSHAGSGLGLAITKKLVTLLEGTITVESKVGAGTTFTLTLPAVLPPVSKRITQRKPTRLPANTRRPNVLIAEDNNETQQLLKHFLEPYYEVTLVADGKSVLQQIQQNVYDAILLDIQLEGSMTGIDVLKAIRKQAVNQALPVLAVTATTLTYDQPYHLHDIGFDGFVCKPFTREQVLEILQQSLGTNPYSQDGETALLRVAS